MPPPLLPRRCSFLPQHTLTLTTREERAEGERKRREERSRSRRHTPALVAIRSTADHHSSLLVNLQLATTASPFSSQFAALPPLPQPFPRNPPPPPQLSSPRDSYFTAAAPPPPPPPHPFPCSVVSVINQANGDEEVDPEEGMCFGTLEDARAYYYRYAARTGFVVKIRTTGWETINDQRVVVNQALHCNRDGYHTSRVKCNNPGFREHEIFAERQWRISRVEVSHSHLLNLKLSGMFSANRQLSMHVKDLIQQNDQAGIRPSKTYQALANAVGGLANLTFTENDVKSYISRHLRISGDETDPKDLLKHFSRMKELNPNFFFEIDVDKNHSIRNVFWADAQCRAAWEYFGDVVTFDTTYKTNRYDMPFGSFIGVNHHGMSMLLGCTLLRNEDTHKEQKELERDAADLRGIIHCVSSSPIEKQFQREYTNSMFRDVQDQFIKKADCDISSVNHHGTSIVCEVDQQKMVFDMSVYSRYQVMYCSQSSDVQCDCFMFQSNGILCCHSLAVLLHFHVTVVSSQYILSRWSKNVSRRHTYIRSSIDMDRSDESMTIFRQLCSDFYNVAQDFVATPEVAAILRDAMDNARQKLKEHKESEHQAAHEAFLEDSKFNSTTYHKH
ncbi:protein FAR1-RELATED SEQUENCE 1-like [Arachis hypogaea]|uniref:protein FAR1-RELATED SEQUENCE 1-like n=1 Tax=Arachis hypogaea TaxID=3818 RepID=UPI003B2128F4